jgi:hypothetical protein
MIYFLILVIQRETIFVTKTLQGYDVKIKILLRITKS